MNLSPAKAAPITPAKPSHPAWELCARYGRVLRAAWEHRHELAGPKRLTDEIAFLPAALSLQEAPVHPAPRRLAYLLMGLFVLALAWSIIGQVDIVATAQGRIIVSDRTKTIQPLEASVVKAVRVRDGDRVKAGQVLVELDPTVATADKASVQEQLNAAISEEARTSALMRAMTANVAPSIDTRLVPGPTLRTSTAALLQTEWADISAKLAKLEAEYTRKQAEATTVKETIAKLEATVPIARTREQDYKKLVTEGFISSHATQDKTRERIELESDLAMQRARLREMESALTESERNREAYKAETMRNLRDRYAQAFTKRQQFSAEHSKAQQKEKLTQLLSPVDGTVQQLAIHTTGGVVTSAQQLMIVVPDSATVSAEVRLANQDIGFVNPGQVAEIKLETFPYTKYGTVEARVETVSADAVVDEKTGASYYPAILVLQQKDMDIDGKRIALSPGMALTGEIKTGKRRVIEYLLSPVQRMGQESLRER